MSAKTCEIAMELYIIRHGQTYGNVGETPENPDEYDDHDPRLTKTGLHQAELVGQRFSGYPFDAVYSSGLRRAMMTATEIVKRQPEDGAHEIKILPILSECGMADDYKGLTFEQEKAMFPYASLADGVKEDDILVYYTAGWNDSQQNERAKQVIQYLRDHYKNGEKIAVTAHAAFNTFLVLAALRLDPTKVEFDPHFINSGVTKIVFFKDGTGRFDLDIQLVYLNDLSHLYKDYPELGLEQCYI